MRLVCPSCRAEYEVDIALLPTEGREVQCSACHFIWFQAHPDHQAPAPVTPVPPTAVPAPSARISTDPLQDGSAAEGSAQTPRTVSGQALEILREEADFESRQRAREAEGLETQPELGLANPAPWPRKMSEDVVQTDQGPQRAQGPASTTPVRQGQSSKAQSEQFPDIDDISTTLEPLGTSRGHTTDWDLPETVTAKRRSFLKGFALPLGVGAVAVAPYLLAPAIIDAVPATEAALTGYVAAIDGLRIRLAGILGG